MRRAGHHEEAMKGGSIVILGHWQRWRFVGVLLATISVIFACSSDPAASSGGSASGGDIDGGETTELEDVQGGEVAPADVGVFDVAPDGDTTALPEDVDADSSDAQAPDADQQPADAETICSEASETACGGDCVDLDVDDDHCGSCDNECGADERCEEGICEELSGCLVRGCVGFNYCDPDDGQCKTGCTVDEQCSDTNNATGVCRDHQCVFECDPDTRLCGTGCVACPTGDAVELTTCDAGACVVHSCVEGYRLCDGDCAECPSEAAQTTCDGDQCVEDDG